MNETVREPVRIEKVDSYAAKRGESLIAIFAHRHDAERFAASEEMLEVCREFVECLAYLKVTGHPLSINLDPIFVEKARAAVARAEGRE